MIYEKTYTQSKLFKNQIHAPAVVTPFNDDGSINEERYANVIRYLLDVVKCDTMLVAGCNGEHYSLTTKEIAQVSRVAAKTIAGRIPFFVNVSRNETAICIERAEAAAAAGATGLALGQATIQDSSDRWVIKRFKDVSRAVPLPMMVYNMSHLTSYSFSPQVMNAVCDECPIECLKDVPTDMEHIRNMIVGVGDRIPVLYGHKNTMVPALLFGSGGYVGTGPELFGAESRSMFMEIHGKSPAEKMDIFCRYALVSDTLMWKLGKQPSGLKAALNMIGIPVGKPREHVDPFTPEQEIELRKALIAARILKDEPRRLARSA